MAPILALLRALAERESTRDIVFYYGARTKRDLCFEDELHELERTLPSFRYVPALSEPDGADWDGETGLITDVLKRREDGLTGAHAYVCGPPPMVEAAMPVLEALGVEHRRIYYDKFTTTGNAEK
jgi:propane monooxygenase reductase subunit